MITYLLTTTLLSWLGMGIYWGVVRRRATLMQQRSFIHVIILASLTLPLLTPKHVQPTLSPTPHVAALPFGAPLDHGDLKRYCRCERPDYTHRIHYRTSATYNFLLSHKYWLGYAIAIAVAITFLILMLQIGYLWRLVRRSRHQPINVDGHSCIILIPERPLGIGAFYLGKSYILWQESLAQLSEAERQAIYRHELSHLLQGNTIEKALLRLIQCLWLANPAFYLMRKELELLSEFIADRTASRSFGGIKPYASLLLKVKLLQAPKVTSALTGSKLRRRIEQMVQPTRESRVLGWLGLSLALIFQMALTSPLSISISDTINKIETYEEISQQAPPETEVIYCQDCETVCLPE